MSDELFKTLQRMNDQRFHDLQSMPRLGEAARFSREALTIMLKGKPLAVESLKVQVEDISGGCVVLAFAFCDKDDNPIVNVGRYEMIGSGSTLTLAQVATCLTFTVS